MQYRPVSIEEMTTKTGKLNPAPYVRILQLIDDKFPCELFKRFENNDCL